MKLKFVVVDLQLSRLQKTVTALSLTSLGLIAFASLASADVPNTFTAGSVLTAADLNENFQNLDARLEAVEAVPQSIVVKSANPQVGTLGMNTVYTHADLVLPAGTWLVSGNATLVGNTNTDAVALGLYNVTAAADVPDSFGAVSSLETGAVNNQGYTTAQTVITTATPTTIRLKAFRNGASSVDFLDWTPANVSTTAALGPHKISAVRLR